MSITDSQSTVQTEFINDNTRKSLSSSKSTNNPLIICDDTVTATATATAVTATNININNINYRTSSQHSRSVTNNAIKNEYRPNSARAASVVNYNNYRSYKITPQSFKFNMMQQPLNDDIDDEEDEKIESFDECKRKRRKRANTWSLPEKNDLIHKFINHHTTNKYNKSHNKSDKYNKMSYDDLLKRVRIIYDRANSLINNSAERKTAICKFGECLNIIYILYKSSLFLTEQQKSNIISMHMNIVLNLGSLYTLTNELGLALKMYEESQLLFEFDTNGFKRSKINLKSYILRGMADVYIKQEEFSSALGLLEEALSLAVSTNDVLTQYQILSTKGRALLDAKQFEKSSIIFEKAILYKPCNKPYDSFDRDTYRNTALCYARIAHKHCSMIYINSTKTYAVKNTNKSILYWMKSASYYKQTVAICKNIFGIHSIEYIQSLYEWSDILCLKGDYNQSYHLYQNILSLSQEIHHSIKKQHQQIINKTKQMIQTLRPYINDNTI